MKENEGGANLPSILSAKNYSPFISKDLELAPKSPVVYRTNTGATPAYGRQAADIQRADKWLIRES